MEHQLSHMLLVDCRVPPRVLEDQLLWKLLEAHDSEQHALLRGARLRLEETQETLDAVGREAGKLRERKVYAQGTTEFEVEEMLGDLSDIIEGQLTNLRQDLTVVFKILEQRETRAAQDAEDSAKARHAEALKLHEEVIAKLDSLAGGRQWMSG